FFQSVVNLSSQAGKSWGKAASNSCEHCQQKSERNNLPVKSDFVHAGQSFGQPADANSYGNCCKHQSEHATRDADGKAFDHRLTQQRSSPCPKSETHCNFAPPANGAYQKQSRQICAGNQQY